jgi:hypothetical protein
MKILLVLAMMLSANSFASTSADPFLGGFCSAFTESGEWAVSYNAKDPRYHCVLVQHELGPTGSTISGQKSGWFDRYDMNHVKVTCATEETSFEMDGHGESLLERAVREAEYREGTHCLFEVKPFFYR